MGSSSTRPTCAATSGWRQLDVQALGRRSRLHAGHHGAAGVPQQLRLYQDALADTAPPPVIGRAALAQRIAGHSTEGWAEMVDDHSRATPVARAVERVDRAGSRRCAARRGTLSTAGAGPGSAGIGAGRPTAAGLDATLESLLLEVRDVAVAWGPPLDPERLVEQLRTTALAEQAAERERLATMRIFGVSPSLVRAEQGPALAPPLARARRRLTPTWTSHCCAKATSAGAARPADPASG